MASIGSTNLTLVNDQPEVEKLWNGRYKLTFFCSNGNKETDWYNENKDEIFPAFGSLQDAQLGEEGAGDWIAPDGSTYDDMRLVESSLEYVPAASTHYVKLVYETLTGAWVQEKDDTVNYTESGLERITRTSVAIVDTAYTSVIGTTDIENDGTTLYLASREIDETDAKWTLKEVWYEAGTLKESTSGANEGLVKKSVTYLKTEPSVPIGSIVVAREIGDFEGLQTIAVTYMVLPTGGAYTYETTQQFTVPGVVDYEKFTDAINTFHYVLDVQPPIPTTVDALVEIEYVADGTGSVGSYYQPNYWTKVTISGSTLYNKAFAKTAYYINHIAGSTGKVVNTTDTTEIDAIQGKRLYQGTTGRIKIDGPSEDIAGTDIVLSITRDEVFTSIDGTSYYKVTKVTGSIPSRPA